MSGGTAPGRPGLSRARGRSAGEGGGRSGVAVGCLVGIVLLVILVLAAVLFLGPLARSTAIGLARDNPQALRLPFVATLVEEELGAALVTPAGTSGPVVLTIEPGTRVAGIAAIAAEAGLVPDPLVLTWQIVRLGLEGRMQSGTFTIPAGIAPAELAERLAGPPDPPPARVTLAFRPALRLEQMAAYLATVEELELDVKDFLALVQDPPRELLERHPHLEALPRGASLEGFMGQGTFEVETAISAEALVDLLLDDWAAEMGEDLPARAKAAGLSVYEAVTLASIVEREARVDRERRKIAGVYTNRLNEKLNPTRIMNADPTVIYAADTLALADLSLKEWTRYVFWDLLGRPLAEVAVPDALASFQTYLNPGLPDAPIATPTRASLDAALDPDVRQGFLFFYACPGSETHDFAKTLAQHEANIAGCS